MSHRFLVQLLNEDEATNTLTLELNSTPDYTDWAELLDQRLDLTSCIKKENAKYYHGFEVGSAYYTIYEDGLRTGACKAIPIYAIPSPPGAAPDGAYPKMLVARVLPLT